MYCPHDVLHILQARSSGLVPEVSSKSSSSSEACLIGIRASMSGLENTAAEGGGISSPSDTGGDTDMMQQRRDLRERGCWRMAGSLHRSLLAVFARSVQGHLNDLGNVIFWQCPQ